MITVRHLHAAGPDLSLPRVMLDSRFLEMLHRALYEEESPPGCCWAVSNLLHLGFCRFADKLLADVFLCWLRGLCGRRFGELVSVEST